MQVVIYRNASYAVIFCLFALFAYYKTTFILILGGI